MMVPGELACYIIGSDGSDRCRVAFLAKEDAAGERGLLLNGAIVRMVEAFFTHNENRTTRLGFAATPLGKSFTSTPDTTKFNCLSNA